MRDFVFVTGKCDKKFTPLKFARWRLEVEGGNLFWETYQLLASQDGIYYNLLVSYISCNSLVAN